MENNKYSLTLKDRIVFAEVFSKTFDHVSRIIQKDILSKIDIKQEDIKNHNMVGIEGGGYSVSTNELNVTFDFSFTDLEIAEIKRGLVSQNSLKSLTENTHPLYEKFIMNK